MDPMTMLMIAGALASIWGAVVARASAKTPEEVKASDEALAQRWAAAEAMLAAIAPNWRARLVAYRSGQDPYGTGPAEPPTP